MTLDDIVTVLKEAEAFGFNKLERHEVAWRYYEAKIEYQRLTTKPRYNGHNNKEIDDYYTGQRTHCAIKARSYIARHIDNLHKKTLPETLRKRGAP